MTKIMLVEDDKSLREIYGVRLLAEGYDIVSAGDGEEALAMAIKERPQLIISDVMMPKVSGYDMLDILRSTTETRNIHVIMMTALSSDEQRTRAESLGADRYLVKSQVGIEDVVHVVHEVLGDNAEIATSTPSPVAPTPIAPQPAPLPPPANTPAPPSAAQPDTPDPSAQAVTVSPAAAPVPVAAPTLTPIQTPKPILAPTPPSTPRPAAPGQQAPKPASLKTRIIQPLSDPSTSPVNINALLDKELAKEAGITEDALPVVTTADQERAVLEEQLRAFSENAPIPTPVVPLDDSSASNDNSMNMPDNIPTVDPSNDDTSAEYSTPTDTLTPPPPIVPLMPTADLPSPPTLPTPGIVTPQALPSVPVIEPQDTSSSTN